MTIALRRGLLFAVAALLVACGDSSSSTDTTGGGNDVTGGGSDVSGGGTDTTSGAVCTYSGAKSCLNDLEAAAACFQPSGTCTNDMSGNFSWASGAAASQSGSTIAYSMNGTACFTGEVGGTSLTYTLPDNRVWTAAVSANGSADWTCPDSTVVTVALNEQPNCLTASSSAVNTAIASCF